MTGPRHNIKPLPGGQTYTATSFDVTMMVDTNTSNVPGPIKVRFYDASGKIIPDGAIKPSVKLSPVAMRAALQAILAVPANPGELMPAWLLRAATPYVQTVYGATV